MLNLFGAAPSPGYRVPVGGATRATSVSGGAGLFGLWPQPQYRTDCFPPVDLVGPRMTTTTTTAAASPGFFASPQPAYRDCRKSLVALDANKADDEGRKPTTKATTKPAR